MTSSTETGNIQYITTPPEEDQATAIGNVHKNRWSLAV